MRRYLWLLACLLPVTIWSAVRPYDWLTWWMETLPVFVGFGFLFGYAKKQVLTVLSVVFIGLQMVVLLVGGHYTYSLVPLFDTLSDWFSWQRNHFDRLGHIAQGIVPTLVAREIFVVHRIVIGRWWTFTLSVSMAMAISALYELLEWAAALVEGEEAIHFLGTQGDGFDTQADMFLALVGAVGALLLFSRWQDRQIARDQAEIARR